MACTACNKTLAVPGGVQQTTVRPASAAQTMLRSAAAKRQAETPTLTRRAKTPPRNRGPLIAVIALLLLVGGGIGGWMIFKNDDKPAENKERVETPPPKKEKPTPEPILNLPKEAAPSFTITANLDRSAASPGTSTQLTVRAVRAADFTGEIVPLLDSLPEGVTADIQNIAEKTDEVVLQFKLAPSVTIGSYPLCVTCKAKVNGKEFTAKSPAVNLVVVTPFDLTIVETATIMLAQGAGYEAHRESGAKGRLQREDRAGVEGLAERRRSEQGGDSRG